VWKILRFTLVLAVLLFLGPRLTSLAYGESAGSSGQDGIEITTAAPAARPGMTVYSNFIGGVTPGDLFYIDATGSSCDISINLYITNTDMLISYFRYLNLKVAVYYEDEDGRWSKTALPDRYLPAATYLTLHNSPASMTLPGNSRYKIAIDSGCYYCINADTGGDDISPRFYLTAEQA
jgi:hypothetical protein